MSERLKVCGTVSLRDGTPLAGFKVQARSDTHGGEAILGVAITDDRGRFTLEGDPPSARPFKIRVLDASANAIAVTRCLFASWGVQQVDLLLAGV